jgi:hypothetical protein
MTRLILLLMIVATGCYDDFQKGDTFEKIGAQWVVLDENDGCMAVERRGFRAGQVKAVKNSDFGIENHVGVCNCQGGT